jgi:hypothetical protein
MHCCRAVSWFRAPIAAFLAPTPCPEGEVRRAREARSEARVRTRQDPAQMVSTGHHFRHVPLGAEPPGRPRRFPYAGAVFVAYGLVIPLAAAGAAALFKLAGYGYLLVRTVSEPLPRAPSWSNLLFGAGAPELALAGGLVGLLLWRRLWQGDDPVLSADVARGALLGAIYSLLLIPFGIFGLFLRTAPKGVPLLVQPFFALLVAIGGTAYSIILPWVWGTVLLIGALVGALSAPVADYVKLRVRE